MARDQVDAERRVKLTDRQRRDIDARCPTCWVCLGAFAPGQAVVYDHLVALELGGTDARHNIFRIHADPCNKTKTRRDAKLIAKVRRLRRSEAEHSAAIAGDEPPVPPRRKQPIRSRGFQTAKGKHKWPSRPMPKQPKKAWPSRPMRGPDRGDGS